MLPLIMTKCPHDSNNLKNPFGKFCVRPQNTNSNSRVTWKISVTIPTFANKNGKTSLFHSICATRYLNKLVLHICESETDHFNVRCKTLPRITRIYRYSRNCVPRSQKAELVEGGTKVVSLYNR